jgi:hypothetical protein
VGDGLRQESRSDVCSSAYLNIRSLALLLGFLWELIPLGNLG